MKRAVSGLTVSLLGSMALISGSSSADENPVQSGDVPTPESVIGWQACTDEKLATHGQITDYYHALDEASDRVKVVETGESTQGKPQVMAIISSEENIANLDRYQEIAQRLARAEDLTDEQARQLAEEGKTVAWADFGIHSTEVAPTQSSPILAHHLATDESEETQKIRDDVIALVVPDVNPDGTTQVAEWYREHVGTEFQDAPLPDLYHPYAGHDNNRDWYMLNLQETQNLGRQMFHEWVPQIIHNAHQTAPFPARIFVPPFSDPVNPNIDARVTRGVNLVGSAMTERLDREGKAGAVSQVQFDMWWNGGMRSAPYYHNQIGILTETAHASATPETYDPDEFPDTFANGESTSYPSIFYPSPYQGGEWHLRDSCDYIVSANLAMFDLAADNRVDWLYGIYEMGRDAIEAGQDETYVVPADQADLPTAVRMIEALRQGGIDVEQATEGFAVGDTEYPEGSYLISGAQAFRAHLTDLLNPQEYPDRREYPDGPPDTPYDITGWTLPLQMGVEVDRHDTTVDVETEDVPLEPAPWGGEVTGRADVAYAIDPRVNNSVIAVNRLLENGFTVERTTGEVETDAGTWPAGTYLVEAEPRVHSELEQWTRPRDDLGLTFATVDEMPAETTAVQQPRIALYDGYAGPDDEGWNKFILENFEFDFSLVEDPEIKAGDLADSYDTILLPDASLESMRDGHDEGAMPPEYAGGMTQAGVDNLREFVEAGGTLVALDSANELAMQEFDLPVTDIAADTAEEDFFIPGSLLKIEVDNTDPLGYGMPAESIGFFAQSPVFETEDGVDTMVNYASDDVLASGWTLGEELVHGQDAVVNASVGQGNVVMLGFRAQHRSQAHGTFKLLFNSLYLGTGQ